MCHTISQSVILLKTDEEAMGWIFEIFEYHSFRTVNEISIPDWLWS
jgi:hypothetical protein